MTRCDDARVEGVERGAHGHHEDIMSQEPSRYPRFMKALPSIHRKEFTWHQGRAPTAEDIFRAHASSDGASSGHAWFDSLVRTEIKHAQERRSPVQPPMTPYEIGFGEATRIRYERFERAALAHDDDARSEECRRRILASAGAPVMKEW